VEIFTRCVFRPPALGLLCGSGEGLIRWTRLLVSPFLVQPREIGLEGTEGVGGEVQGRRTDGEPYGGYARGWGPDNGRGGADSAGETAWQKRGERMGKITRERSGSTGGECERERLGG